MAEEITSIIYDSRGRSGMKKDEVLNVFQYRKTHNLTTPIHLILHCYDKRHGHNNDEEFNETAEMRTAMLENIVHINHFAIYNCCIERNNYSAWFSYLLQFLRTDHGGTKYVVKYHNLVDGYVNHLSLEHAIQLSDALLLNNHNDNDNDNSHIEQFTLRDNFCNVEAFQIIWNTLLETGVPLIELSPTLLENRDGGNNNNNNNINFTGLSTNTSMKRLMFSGISLSQQNWRNLFLSIQGNTGLENLKIHLGVYRRSLNNTELLPCFTEMLRKNITLIDVEANRIYDNYVQNDFNNVITIETTLNRKFNQYLMKHKEEEEKNASTIATPPPARPAHLVAAAERKRQFKMGCLLHAFRNKAVMRDTILFHFLSDTPDLFIDNNVQQNLDQVFRH